MLGKHHFEVLNIIGQRLRGNKEMFGGIKLLFCGDLLQLPPINDEWIFKSHKFKNWETIQFTEPRRYPDLKYFEILQRLRVGETTKEDYSALYKRFIEYRKIMDNIDDLVIKPTIVFSKKSDVLNMNEKELRKLPGKTLLTCSIDTKQKTGEDEISFIDRKKNIIDTSVPEKTEFKIGAQVILKINYDINLGLCNGSRGVITDINFETTQLKVKFKNNEELWFGTHEWKSQAEDWTYKRTQIPFILGYAITVHSCQGMTLDCAVIDLGYSIFLPAQAYVALSRVRTLKGLYISKIAEKSFQADEDAVEYMEKLFPEKTWAIMTSFDEEACEDFLDEVPNKGIIKTNSIGFVNFLSEAGKIEPERLHKKMCNYTEEQLYNVYRKDPPQKIYLFYEGKVPEYFKKFNNIVNKEYTQIIEWQIDVDF